MTVNQGSKHLFGCCTPPRHVIMPSSSRTILDSHLFDLPSSSSSSPAAAAPTTATPTSTSALSTSDNVSSAMAPPSVEPVSVSEPSGILPTPTTSLETSRSMPTLALEWPTGPVVVANGRSHGPILPHVSFIDVLEVDPRPSLVVCLGPSLPTIVYSNPALTSSPALRAIVSASSLAAQHAALWGDITHQYRNGTRLSPVTHLGISWTRTVLGGYQNYAIISANQTASAAFGDAAETARPAKTPEATAAAAAATATATATAAVPAESPAETQKAEIAKTSSVLISNEPSSPLHAPSSVSVPQLAKPLVSTMSSLPPTALAKNVLSSESLLSTPEPPTPPISAVCSHRCSDAEPLEYEFNSSATVMASPPAEADIATQLPEGEHGPADASGIATSDASDAGDYLGQFEKITSFMPVGMCVFDAAGNVFSANDAWFQTLGCPRRVSPTLSATSAVRMVMDHTEFLACVDDDDKEVVERFFSQAATVTNCTFGFRVKKLSPSPSPSTPMPMSTPTPTLPPARNGLENATPEKRVLPVNADAFKAATPSPADVPDPPARRDNNLVLPSSAVSEEPPRDSHVLATAHSETDAQGNLVRVLVCLRDISENQHFAEVADRHAQQANNLRRMAQFATVGMYEMDIDGRLRGANRVFYEMCGLDIPPATGGEYLPQCIVHPWIECVVEEDHPTVQACFERLVKGSTGGNDTDHEMVEVRFKTPWTSDDGAGGRIVAPRWVEASFLPVRDSEGKVQSITGCLNDISLRRWQLERERQVKEEAIESKHQQENFVDITSHEIRNPLTVIMHCGDAVLESLTKLRAELSTANERVLLEDAIYYSEIIVSSALHQKAIVDDILTMSKLDSDLLAVTPVTVDPLEIVHSTLKMFEVQARQQNIQLRMNVKPSYFKELPALTISRATSTVATTTSPAATPFLILDPSRVKQILINLLTNALKFTQSVNVREVTTTVSVSHTRPTDAMCNVAFVPQPPDNRLAPAYGGKRYRSSSSPLSSPSSPASESPPFSPMGESVFLIFEVRDTGEGLTKDGMDSLFKKFVQANSSTHVKHGGSGLGLFISKRLAEIQNGAIGVASEPGIGSTFVFYIEAYIPPSSTVPEVLSLGEAAKIALSAGFGNAGTNTTATTAPTATNDETNVSPTSDCTTETTETIEAVATTAARKTSSKDGSVVGGVGSGNSANHGQNGHGSESKTAAVPASSPVMVYDRVVSRGSVPLVTMDQDQSQDPGETVTTGLSLLPTGTMRPLLANSGNSSGNSSGRLASISMTPPEIRGVLLVEDNIINQRVTRRYFEKSGFHVEVAANGLEAMERIQASDRCVPGAYPISVVLMDMEMPVQDGLTCTRHIRALEAAGKFAGGRMPVLMITGNARPEQIADARAAGCDDVVIKPFQMHDLFEIIKLAMQKLWEDDIRTLANKVLHSNAIDSGGTMEGTEATKVTKTADMVDMVVSVPTVSTPMLHAKQKTTQEDTASRLMQLDEAF